MRTKSSADNGHTEPSQGEQPIEQQTYATKRSNVKAQPRSHRQTRLLYPNHMHPIERIPGERAIKDTDATSNRDNVINRACTQAYLTSSTCRCSVQVRYSLREYAQKRTYVKTKLKTKLRSSRLFVGPITATNALNEA